MTGPTATAAKAFKNIGLSTKDFTDQKGDLLSIDKVFQLINSHLSGKSGTEKAAFYKAVFGATGMEAAQDLANTAAEIGNTDQSITTLIKHIRQDETGNYIDRLAKKNMQSTKNQLAAFKQTMWAMGIMIGQELMPTVNQVTKSIAKWVVSKEGRQSIQEVATMTKSIMISITSRSGSIMKFLAGTIEGIHDVGKATSVVLSPVGKLIDFLSGQKGDGAKWMGRIAGWLLAGAAALKVFNGLFGWTLALGKDIRAMAKNGLFGSKLSEEQIQLAGINEQLGITNNLLQQINQNPINPAELSQNVSTATTYKAEHGPAGTSPNGGSSIGGYSFTANSKSGEAPKTNFSYKGEEGKPTFSYTQNGEYAGKGVAEQTGRKFVAATNEAIEKSGAAEQTGMKFAKTAGEAVEKSGGLAKGVEGAAEGVVKSRGLWSKGLEMGSKLLNGLNYVFLTADLAKSVIGMLTSTSKKVRQSGAWNLGGALVGGGIGALVGLPGVGATAGSFVGTGLDKLSSKESKRTKDNRMAGLGYGTVAGMGLGAPFGPYGVVAGAALGSVLGYGIGGLIPTNQAKVKRKRSVLDASQTKDAEGLAKTIKKLGTTNLELKVGVNSKSIKKTGTTLENMYRSMQKSADKASTARMKSEKKALDYALKSGTINKKQYQKALSDIQAADTKRQKHNKKVADNLVKDTKAETKARAKAYDQYYKELKKKGVSQEFAENNLKNKLREIDSKYASSRKKNEKALTKALEKNWNTSNNKQLSKMKSIVKKKGKLSEKEAGQLIKNSAKVAEKTIKNAKKQHDKTVKSAESEYKGRVSALKKLRDDSKTISNSQYKALKKKAEDEKKAKIDAADAAQKGVVKQAKQQHKKTIEYAEDQSKEVSKHIVRQGNNSIDSYNAQAVNATGVMKSILEVWNSFVSFFGGKPTPIAKNTPKQSAHIKANSYATGGVARNGLALVGEAGPELVYSPYADQVRFVGAGGAEITQLKAGEHVLNARDTERLMNGSFSGTLPGYAKGTSLLGSWLGKIKKASDKVLKKIPKAIKNMLKAPAKWVTNLFSTKWDAPKTAYPFAKISEMSMLKDTLKKNIVKTVKGIFKKANNALEDAYDDVATGGTFSPSMIRKAAAQMHVHPSDAFIKNLQAVIQNESGGRNIVQQIHDINSGGNEAAGILQYTPGTFAAYAMPGHRNRMNPYDQLLAFFNNSDWEHSIGWTRIWGVRKMEWLHSGPQGHRRYANGGLVDTEQLAHVAEGNNPEMIIPLSPLKRPRALQLTQQVIGKFNAESSQGIQHTNSNVEDKLDVLIDQFTSVLGQLKQVISNQDNPVPAIIGTAQAYSALNKYKKTKELKTKMLY